MDLERPHRTTSTPTTTSELFICFTSRLSKSSSMRLSSKSILSPSHNNDTKASQTHTLSTSLSRRLRHNGSLRGAQSPAMFPSKKNSNNRGSSSSGFAENPEPSSPKVTCIGQVRVKTKKQGKKMKMRACRTSKRLSGGGGGGSGGEASFRRIESGAQEGSQSQNQQAASASQQECELNHRNQRWVHLPITICEALRAFGSEFSCLFPCKSSCFSSGLCGGGGNNVKREERENSANSSSCAVFRWLVSLQEGEEADEKRRDIELVVGGEEDGDDDVEERERRVVMERDCSRRRSIFDDMEFDDLFKDLDKNNGKMNNDEEDEEEEEEGRRRSLCVPPKNALLLMRCRSDPMKMASLSRKFWDPPLPPQQVDVVNGGNENDEVVVQEERENVVEEVKKVEEEVELEEDETEEIEDKTEEIANETGEIEDKTEEIEEKIETLGDLNEEMGEMLDDNELGEAKIETLAYFVAEEEEEFQEVEHKQEEEKEQETEEKQIMENIEEIQEEEKCEIFEETHFVEDDETTSNRCSIDAITVEEKVENGENEENEVEATSEENQEVQQEKNEKEESSYISTTTMSSNSTLNSSEESTAESKEPDYEEDEKTTLVEVEKEIRNSVEEDRKNSIEEERKSIEESNNLILSKIDEKPNNNNNKPPKLPDCLLLMMCEPKLSMEVSKETWVCSTDFIRWLPERHHSKKVSSTNKTDGSDESTVAKTKKKPAMVGPPVQPARSSISFPAGSVANMIEQKLVKAGGYEPLILTRCKSAPIRSTAKIEPHRPATFGVGKAGVGF